jgi:hypothetical protein
MSAGAVTGDDSGNGDSWRLLCGGTDGRGRQLYSSCQVLEDETEVVWGRRLRDRGEYCMHPHKLTVIFHTVPP